MSTSNTNTNSRATDSCKVVLVALVFVLLTACEPPVPAPTEEPDRPTFAEGEAIAIVQTYGGNCPNEFDPFKQGSWADTYLGNGQWEVVLDSPLWGDFFVWRVFEQSRSISLDVSRSGASFIPPC